MEAANNKIGLNVEKNEYINLTKEIPSWRKSISKRSYFQQSVTIKIHKSNFNPRKLIKNRNVKKI